jgi:hypothetical protein
MNTRAINALIEIMLNEDISAHRRIEACEGLLTYEGPPEVAERAKEFLTKTFEDSEVGVTDRLDALKLMRKFEAAKVALPTVRTARQDGDRREAVAAIRDFAAALEAQFSYSQHAAERLGRRFVFR